MKTQFRSLVVPLDGSAFGESALPTACAIAQSCGAQLRLVHVYSVDATPIYIDGEPILDETLAARSRQHAQIYLEQTCQRVRLTLGKELDVTTEFVDRTLESIVNESAGSFLAEYVAATATELVVMTTHGRGGLERLWLGSVADTLVRLSRVPVLLLRPQAEATTVAPAFPFKKILVPLDGSALAEAILAPTLALGQGPDTIFDLLHVFELSLAVEQSVEQALPRVQAKAYLERMAEQVRASGGSAAPQVVVAEQIAPTILRFAEQQGIDLIAVATHGRGGLRRWLLGSVADKVLRGTTLPLLLYRPPEPHSARTSAL